MGSGGIHRLLALCPRREHETAIQLVLDHIAETESEHGAGVTSQACVEEQIETDFGAPEQQGREHAGGAVGNELRQILAQWACRSVEDVAPIEYVFHHQADTGAARSEEHTSELQSQFNLV